MEEMISDSFDNFEIVTDKEISPAWTFAYLALLCPTIKDFAEVVRHSKTVTHFSFIDTQQDKKLITYFKGSGPMAKFRANCKGFVGPEVSWQAYNVTGGFDRFKASLRADIPFWPNENSELSRHLYIPFFEKTSFKGIYSVPLGKQSDKVQLGYKSITRVNSLTNKIFFSLGQVFENVSASVFREWSGANILSGKAAFKLKCKFGKIDNTSLPQGSASTMKFKHDLFTPAAPTWHLKIGTHAYVKSEFLPSYTNFEYATQLVISNYITSSLLAAPGFVFRSGSSSTPNATCFAHHALFKLNYYNIPVLRDYDIASFAYFALLKRATELYKPAFGMGLEKYFDSQRIKARLFFDMTSNNIQLNFTKE